MKKILMLFTILFLHAQSFSTSFPFDTTVTLSVIDRLGLAVHLPSLNLHLLYSQSAQTICEKFYFYGDFTSYTIGQPSLAPKYFESSNQSTPLVKGAGCCRVLNQPCEPEPPTFNSSAIYKLIIENELICFNVTKITFDNTSNLPIAFDLHFFKENTSTVNKSRLEPCRTTIARESFDLSGKSIKTAVPRSKVTASKSKLSIFKP